MKTARQALAATVLMALATTMALGASIKGQVVYKPFDPIVLKAQDITSTKAQFLWDIEGDARVVEDGGTIYVWAPPGKYRVTLTAIDFDSKKVERARFAFSVEGKPVPPDPGPVPPDPGPKPPDPVPPQPPAPIPVTGFRVLIIEESAERAKLPVAQLKILFDKGVRDYLNSKCVKGADQKTAEWRIWDKDADASGEAKHWQDALKRPRQSVPWVIISDGKTGYEGPLPATVEAALELFKRYAPVSSGEGGGK